MGDLLAAGAAEIAERIALIPEIWVAISFPDGHLHAGSELLLEELETAVALDDNADDSRAVLAVDAPMSCDEILATLTGMPSMAVIVIRGIERVSPSEIRQLDFNRNALLSVKTLVVLTTNAGVSLLSEQSPNIWSWISGQCFRYDSSKGLMDTDARLESLREYYRMTDAEVVERAARGELPRDSAFVEWLALLGKG